MKQFVDINYCGQYTNLTSVARRTETDCKTSGLFQRTFHGCSTHGRIQLKPKCPYVFLCAKAYRSTTSGCRGTSFFRRYDRELVLKSTISLKKSWGGYRRTTLEQARDIYIYKRQKRQSCALLSRHIRKIDVVVVLSFPVLSKRSCKMKQPTKQACRPVLGRIGLLFYQTAVRSVARPGEQLRLGIQIAAHVPHAIMRLPLFQHCS